MRRGSRSASGSSAGSAATVGPERGRRQVRRPAADGEEERRAAAGLALHPHPPAQALGEPAADHQPQAGAAVDPGGRRVGLAERLEQPVQRRGRDADARIAHGEEDLDLLPASARRRPPPPAARSPGRELDRVVEQVHQDLAQAGRIALDRRRHAAPHPASESEPLAGRLRRHDVDRLVQAVAQDERGDLDVEHPGLDLRDVEDVVDHPQQGLAAVPDRLGVVPLRRRQARVQEHAGHAEHRVHRRADLVAHVGQELALGAARLLGPRLLPLQIARALLDQAGQLAGSGAGHGRSPPRGAPAG